MSAPSDEGARGSAATGVRRSMRMTKRALRGTRTDSWGPESAGGAGTAAEGRVSDASEEGPPVHATGNCRVVHLLHEGCVLEKAGLEETGWVQPLQCALFSAGAEWTRMVCAAEGVWAGELEYTVSRPGMWGSSGGGDAAELAVAERSEQVLGDLENHPDPALWTRPNLRGRWLRR